MLEGGVLCYNCNRMFRIVACCGCKNLTSEFGRDFFRGRAAATHFCGVVSLAALETSGSRLYACRLIHREPTVCPSRGRGKAFCPHHRPLRSVGLSSLVMKRPCCKETHGPDLSQSEIGTKGVELGFVDCITSERKHSGSDDLQRILDLLIYYS